MTTVFFSYSHRDESWRNELEVHLAALKRQDLIDTWHDRRIPAGDEWQQRISEHLEEADVILLLISPYFIASDYCYDIEMTRALERHQAGEARVIPVVLEPCLWQDLPFGKLNAVPADGRPVSKFPNHHDAFVEIAGAIRDALPAPRAAARTAIIPQGPIVEHSPRSSNLRVKCQFTDEDKHRFLSESFDYVRRFFEGSIEELATRNTEITGTVQRVDAIRFTARLYRQGREVASCTIWQGSQTGYALMESNTVNRLWESAIHVGQAFELWKQRFQTSMAQFQATLRDERSQIRSISDFDIRGDDGDVALRRLRLPICALAAPP